MECTICDQFVNRDEPYVAIVHSVEQMSAGGISVIAANECALYHNECAPSVAGIKTAARFASV